MQTILQVLFEAGRRLAGQGALHNAAGELDRATRDVVELDAQLVRLTEPPPRRAA